MAAWLAYAIIETVWRTSRLRFVNLERLTTLVREQGAVVPVFWHQHLLMGARFIADRRAELKTGFMISPSVDGQAPTMLAGLYGAHVVRGSGSYTGMRAVRGVYQAIVKDGISPGITPDGPRGPCYVVQDGVMSLAQLTGLPIIPFSYRLDWKIRLKSWDRFQIPLPFSRCEMIFEQAIRVPREASDAEREALRQKLEQALNGISAGVSPAD